VQDANPLLLRVPARIEAIFCCQFLAQFLAPLLEREIRTAMRQAATADIPLYPELRACETPSAERILAVFNDITRHELHRNGQLVQTFEPELNPLQQQILQLLGVPATAYAASGPKLTDAEWGAKSAPRSAERQTDGLEYQKYLSLREQANEDWQRLARITEQVAEQFMADVPHGGDLDALKVTFISATQKTRDTMAQYRAWLVKQQGDSS
jgi:hypothetical protein